MPYKSHGATPASQGILCTYVKSIKFLCLICIHASLGPFRSPLPPNRFIDIFPMMVRLQQDRVGVVCGWLAKRNNGHAYNTYLQHAESNSHCGGACTHDMWEIEVRSQSIL